MANTIQATDTTIMSKNWLMMTTVATSFLIPLVLKEPQLLVGTVVNTVLVLAAGSQMSQKIKVVVAVMPSLAAISRGWILASMTPYLFYLLPAIWLGNYAYMQIHQSKINRLEVVMVASLVKAGLIASMTFLLIKGGLVPKALMFSMSVIQLTTAGAGSILALLALRQWHAGARK